MPLSTRYHPVAVIDIGSNSVRIVIFDGIKRHVRPIFNEKALCGLGSDIATTGRLPEAGKREAAACFARYVRLARAHPVETLRVIATAAIRDAEDGSAFIAELSARHGVDIEVIPGDEEARLAAQGVLATIFEPKGLVGDLGGGSLELVAISPHAQGQRASLPLGVLRVWQQGGGDPAKMRRIISSQLDSLVWLGAEFPQFYAIGGSFRMLARLHMRRVDYPLRLLHHYHLSKRELKRMTEDMLRLSLSAIASLKGMQEERAHMVVPSLLVLEQVLAKTGCDEIVFSTGGIREGLLYDALSPAVQLQDPLLAYVEDVLPEHRLGSYSEALIGWLAPLTARVPEVPARLIRAFAALSEAAIGMHPECRAQWAYDMVLYSSLTGVTHPERVWLALALYHRYRAKLKLDDRALSLIPEVDRASARLVGIGSALAYALSGGATSLLGELSLKLDGARITLHSSGDEAITDAEALEKMLEGLGESVRALSSKDR